MRLSFSLVIFCALVCSGVSADQTSEPVVEADLRLVEDSLSVYHHNDQTTVMGEIRNHSDFPAVLVEVQIAGFDEASDLVSAGNSLPWNMSVGNTRVFFQSRCEVARGTGGCILPGEIAWFRSYQGMYEVDYHSFSVVAFGFSGESAIAGPSIEVVDEIQVEPYLYGSRITARVRNAGSADVVGLSAITVERDSSGRLIDVWQSSVTGTSIGGFGGGIRAGQELDLRLPSFASSADFGSCELFFHGIDYQGGSFPYAVAGIAHQDGYGEAGWRSSLSVANRSGAEGHLRLRFYHSGSVVEQYLTLPDRGLTHWDDVVVGLFEVEDNVAGLVRIDSDVPLTITARTLNQSDRGGLGQLMPTLTPLSTHSNEDGLLAPLRGGPEFRTNIGFVNLSDSSCEVMVRLYEPSGDLFAEHGPIPVAANSWHQINDVVPAELRLGYAVVRPSRGGYHAFWSYASVIDALSGDPTTIVADQETAIIPVLFTPAGSDPSGWSD